MSNLYLSRKATLFIWYKGMLYENSFKKFELGHLNNDQTDILK